MGVIVSGKLFFRKLTIWIRQTDWGKEIAWFLIRLLYECIIQFEPTVVSNFIRKLLDELADECSRSRGSINLCCFFFNWRNYSNFCNCFFSEPPPRLIAMRQMKFFFVVFAFWEKSPMNKGTNRGEKKSESPFAFINFISNLILNWRDFSRSFWWRKENVSSGIVYYIYV